MSIRAAILFCCIAGAACAQEPPDDPPAPVATPQNSDSSTGNKPDQQKPPTSGDHGASGDVQKAGHVSQQKSPHGTPAKVSPNKAPLAIAAAASPLQKLLDALDAAIHQPVMGAPRADRDDLLTRETQLQNELKANGDRAEISRKATEMLMTIYAPPQPAPPPALDVKPAQPAATQVNLLPIIVIGIAVALISPLICVVGFWWAGKNSETALRKGLRDAGLL
jgi:hypothetical protein